MTPHETDQIGYPVDPKLRALAFRLGDLAAEYRQHLSPEHDKQLVEECHATIAKLFQLGWDAVLDIESELPDQLKPEEYRKRYPL